MHCDDEGEWTRRKIRIDTSMTSHDGFYMLEKSGTVSGVGVLAFCNATGKPLKIGLAEKSKSANSYRVEILGGMLAQLILRAATAGTACGNYVVKIYCNNKGVLCHGQDWDMRMKEH